MVGGVAVLHRAVADHRLPGRQHRPPPAPARRPRGATRRRSAARAPSQRAELAELGGRRLRASGSRAGGRSRSAMPAEHPHVGHGVAARQHLAEGPHPALPVDEAAGLLGRPARPGSTTSAQLGDRAGAQLEADHEAGRLAARRGRRRGRAGRRGSTPPTTRAPSSPAGGRGEDRVAVAAVGSAGRRRPRPCRRRRGPRRRRPAGRRAAGRAGSRRRARHGHRRGAGTQASRAPVWRGQHGRRASARPARSASRSPTRITPPPSSASSPSCGELARWPRPRRRARRGTTRGRPSCAARGVVYGATAKIRGALPRGRPCAAGGTAIAGLLLGLEAERAATALARSRSP